MQPKAFRRAVEELCRLPGIGSKTAQRLVFHLLKRPTDETRELGEALNALADQVRRCSVCNGLTDDDPCPICRDVGRDRTAVCVVEEPSDAFALEATGAYRGLYHVLGGAFDPLEGVGPEELAIAGLVDRVKAGGIDEIILATNPSIEGEATAAYLADVLKPLNVRLTRLARGLPFGGDLEYADPLTLGKALESRLDVS
jgi:recombination protein RecR